MTSPLDIFRLDDRVVLITGGAGGLGTVFTRALAGVGANVVLVGRRQAALDEAAATLTAETGRTVLGFAADVTDEAQVAAAVTYTVEKLGRLDVLINNAGTNVRKPTTEFSLAEWRGVLDTSLTGSFLCAKHALPHMIAAKWGRVIHVASMLGQVGLADRPAYTAAKGGMIQLARTMALEVAQHGVTVNALAPGPFMTELNRQVFTNPVAFKSFIDKLPIGRFGEPDELSGAILFLTSNASSFMTGNVLTIDGGWTAQ
jgi:NAD(P)-dependent dehydrogenase (short-subunit alcohol dehydrogenase family)